ncbi:MAG: C4-type zinc ribbon domain-containing protein [Nitrospinae bacterium]|jgi:uncharacterized protein|nr:C4-type zinc ribbon domain-containing protein [Nitrospinota bacterium]MDA1109833.1 C4-type zinc ribbon domain-containing protein [Nitrospinota bacterium]
MNAELQKLIDLQALDREISEFENALASIPNQIQSATAEMAALTKEIEQAREVIASMRKSQKQLQADVQTENDHMAKTKTKLPLVKTNKEYTAIVTEVDSVKQKISSIEDKELEIMEALEIKEGEIPAIEARFKEEEITFKEYKAKKEAEGERVKQELEDARDKRQGLIGCIAPEWAKSYNKITSHRDGVAVVRLLDSVCQGCFQLVLPQVVIDVKVGNEIHPCPHCSRFLFWVEETEEHPAVPK